jgi:protein phosphatase
LLLCSDGLTRHVSTAEIGHIAQTTADPPTTTATLIDLANARGGEDNVSVIVIELQATDAPSEGDTTVELRPIDPQSEDTRALPKVSFLDDLITPPGEPTPPGP